MLGRTTLIASWNWAMVTFFACFVSRNAIIGDSRHRPSMSAPEYPSRSTASSSRSTPSRGMPLVWTFRIARRASLFGVGTRRMRSNRPVRSMAGSSRLGRFVAPITQTPSKVSSPSIEVRSWLTTRSLTPLSVSKPRTCATASNSSRKTMQGATCFAFLKIMRTAFSDSPTHFDMTSGPLIEMKFASDSVADVGELGKERVSVLLRAFDRHAAGVNLQDLLPSHPVRHSDLDLAVETTGPAQRGIDRLVPIRRADHDDLATAGEAVHQREELGDDPTLDLAGDLLTFRRDRVEFVDEQDARGVLLRLLEFLTKAFLALPVVLRHDLRALNRIEVRARLVRDGLRDEGLARPRRAIKEHPFRWIDAEPLEQFRVLQRELDHLADFHQLLFQPADVLVRHGRREDLALADRLFFHFDDRVVLNLHDAFRRGADDHERQGTAHERNPRDDDDIALVQRPLQ